MTVVDPCLRRKGATKGALTARHVMPVSLRRRLALNAASQCEPISMKRTRSAVSASGCTVSARAAISRCREPVILLVTLRFAKAALRMGERNIPVPVVDVFLADIHASLMVNFQRLSARHAKGRPAHL